MKFLVQKTNLKWKWPKTQDNLKIIDDLKNLGGLRHVEDPKNDESPQNEDQPDFLNLIWSTNFAQ